MGHERSFCLYLKDKKELSTLDKVVRIKNATDALTDVGTLTDVGRKASKARDTKESTLGDARVALGESIVTPGDAGETIVTPGDAKEPPTTATRTSMKGSSLGHSLGVRRILQWNVGVTCQQRIVLSYLTRGQLVVCLW